MLLAANLPAELKDSVRGASPGFVDLNALDLTPSASSPCVGAASAQNAHPTGFPFPAGLGRPLFEPPRRKKLAFGAQVRRCDGPPSIGAFQGVCSGAAGATTTTTDTGSSTAPLTTATTLLRQTTAAQTITTVESASAFQSSEASSTIHVLHGLFIALLLVPLQLLQ
jgi:hypothetical protein